MVIRDIADRLVATIDMVDAGQYGKHDLGHERYETDDQHATSLWQYDATFRIRKGIFPKSKFNKTLYYLQLFLPCMTAYASHFKAFC